MSSLTINNGNVACPVAMISVAGVAVVLRIAVRLKRLAIEDALVVVSLVFSGVSTGFLIKLLSETIPIMYLKLSDLLSLYEGFGKAAYLSSLFYSLSFCFVQMAFLLSCLRWLSVSPPVDVEGRAPLPRPRSRAVKAIFGLIIIYNLWLFSMQMAKCIPLQVIWSGVAGPVTCLPQAVWWTANFLHILVNFVLLLLGIAVAVRTWIREILATTKKRTTTRTGQKIGLAFVFVLGFFVCIISILRVIRSPSDPSNNPKPDPGMFTLGPDSISTWDRADLWTVIELNVAIICVCLSSLNPLWSVVTRWFLSWCPIPGGRSQDGIEESESGSMSKHGFGELEGTGRGELDTGHGHEELEAVYQRQELDGVARQQRGELDGTVVAELDGGTTYALHGQEEVIGEKHQANVLPIRRT
ncbi:hypothetical protein V8F06_008141 [Rhypophila decipiens]